MNTHRHFHASDGALRLSHGAKAVCLAGAAGAMQLAPMAGIDAFPALFGSDLARAALIGASSAASVLLLIALGAYVSAARAVSQLRPRHRKT